MKKITIALTILLIMSGIIGATLNNTQRVHQSPLNAALNNGVLYADGLPGDTDTIRYPQPPPFPPIK